MAKASATAKGFGASMTGIGRSMDAAGRNMMRVGGLMTRRLTLPLVAAGGVAVKMGLDFEKAFTQISAVTNISQKQIGQWKTEVLDLAGKTARAPTELAEALYFLASAGLDASEIMPTLEMAAKAAASGLGETQDIARLTANVINAYADSGMNAARATDILVAAVREGTAEPEEFANAMGRILPIAAKAGVSFDEIAASLAGLSNIGLGVNEGVTAMRSLLNSLVAPGTQAAETLKEIGISADEMRRVISEEGILGAMRLLEERTGGNIDTMRKVIPNIRALTGQFGLTGQEADKVSQIFQNVTDSTGSMDKAFEETQKGPAFQMEQSLNKLRVAAIELGQQLIPVAQDIIDVVKRMAEWFGRLSPEMRQQIVRWGLIAAAAGPVLTIFGGLLRVGGGLVRMFGALALVKAAGALSGVGTAAGGAATAVGAGGGGLVGAVGLLGGALAALAIGGAIADFIDLRGKTAAWAEKIRDGTAAVSELRDVMAESDIGGWALPTGAAEALDAYIERLGTWASKNLRVGESIGFFSEVLKEANNVTEGQIKRVGLAVDALDSFGYQLTDSEKRMVTNLLKVGDFQGAMKILRERLNDATTAAEKNTGAGKLNASQADRTERQQRGLGKQYRHTGDDATTAKGKTEDYTTAIKNIPNKADTRLVLDAGPARNAMNEFLREVKGTGLQVVSSDVAHTIRHTGGIAPDEELALIQKGEGIIPREQTQRHRALVESLIRGEGLPEYHEGGIAGAVDGANDNLRRYANILKSLTVHGALDADFAFPMAAATGSLAGATPAIRQIYPALLSAFPDIINFGIKNIRPIAGTNTWSQHAFGNALDASRPGWPASLDPVWSWLVSHAGQLPINIPYSLFRKYGGGSPHLDHIHIAGDPLYGGDPYTGGHPIGYGGIATAAMRAVIGERGPEAVIPLDQRGVGVLTKAMTQFARRPAQIEAEGPFEFRGDVKLRTGDQSFPAYIEGVAERARFRRTMQAGVS